MAATTYPEFNDQTEAVEVAKAFADNIRGKTILITGANKQGVGYGTMEGFASQSPAHLILAGRTLSKIEECISALKSSFPDSNTAYHPLIIDLSSQKSVRTAATDLLSWKDVPQIDILVNNAGIMLLPERTLSEDGIEMHFATNHIGHFLFTALIMPKLLASTSSSPTKGATRIINVTSGSPMFSSMRWSDTNFNTVNKDLPEQEQPVYKLHEMWGTSEAAAREMSYIPLEGYNQSKVANVLFSVGLNQRLFSKHGIVSIAVHPGQIKTELGRSIAPEMRENIKKLMESGVYRYRSQGAGGATSVCAATDPKLGEVVGEGMGVERDGKESWGVFMSDCQVNGKANALAVKGSEAERLWGMSEGLVGERFEW